MKQEPFENKYRGQWQVFEQRLETTERHADFPERYRQLCHHLAVARSRNYSAALCNRLNSLVLRGHHHLYAQRRPWQQVFSSFLQRELPQILRHNAGTVWLSMLLFFGSMIATGYACALQDDLILSFLNPEQVAEYQAMYDPQGEHQGEARSSADDWLMFGFYIKNNISIGFQTFAGGIFAGVGSIFIVLFNGLMIGAVAGHLTQIGFSETFYPFVIGHGAFELTAIALAGAAGLRLGFACINPGPYRRVDALRLAGKDAIVLVYAVIIMLLIAAFLEAFWSSSRWVPASVKYAVGGVFWILVLSYLVACTWRPRSRHEP